MIPLQRTRWPSWLLPSVGALAAALFVPLRSAEASIMLALELPELVRQAEHIAVVEVASVHAAWDEKHERIYSTIDLKVIEHWKTPMASLAKPSGAKPSAMQPSAVQPSGAKPSAVQPSGATPSDRLIVVQAGGTVGDMSMTVTGMGTFVPGERSLVFLRGPVTHAQVVGMTQGKRAMRYESAARHWLVAPPDLRQTKLVRPATLPAGRVTPTPAPAASRLSQSPAKPETGLLTGSRETPLDDLRVEVKRLLGTSLP